MWTLHPNHLKPGLHCTMQARSKPASVAKLTPDQLRMRELERDLAIAREERDILKKAAA